MRGKRADPFESVKKEDAPKPPTNEPSQRVITMVSNPESEVKKGNRIIGQIDMMPQKETPKPKTLSEQWDEYRAKKKSS